MNLINKIFEKFNISFVWKDNQKKLVKQNAKGLIINQEPDSIINIYQVQNLTVANIEELAGLDAPQDPNSLLKSAGQRFLAEQKTKQRNLKTVVDKAELSAISNPQEVEQDWFLKWMEISQTISRENVQEILARIISGEVKKSGSFSLRSLDVLKNLSKAELNLFQIFCDISYSIPNVGDAVTCVICEPFGNPGQNGMSSIGLSYPSLAILQDAGLIQTDLNAWREFPIPVMLQIPFAIGSTSYVLQKSGETIEEKHQVKIINFTSAGLELRSALNIGTKSEYNSRFLEWIKDKWKMVPIS
jgi:hypothetical protein